MHNLRTSVYKPFVPAICYLLIQSYSLHFCFTEILLQCSKKFILFNGENRDVVIVVYKYDHILYIPSNFIFKT
jgi:hypothetical protein